MKVSEIFDPEYYDEIQHHLDRHKQSKPAGSYDYTGRVPDSSTDIEDFIISQYEQEQITYDEAMKKLKQVVDPEELFFWEMELAAARDLKGN